MIRELGTDILKYIPAKVVPAIVGLVAVPLITRLVPPANYGNYILVKTTISILSIGVGWLANSIIRFYPTYKEKGKEKKFINAVIVWLIMTIVIVTIPFLSVILALKNSLGSLLYKLMLVGILVFISRAVFTVLQNLLRTKRKIILYSSFKVWHNVARLGIGVLFVILLGLGVEGLFWGALVSVIIVLPFSYKFALARGSIGFGNYSNYIEIGKKMLVYGLPLVFSNVGARILSLGDRFILKLFRGSQEVGIYSASYAVSEKGIFFIASLLMLASGPLSIKIWEKEDRRKSKEFASRLTRYYVIIGVPAVAGLSVLARPLIGVFTAKSYYAGFRIVPIVAMGGFFFGLQQRYQMGLLFHKKTLPIMLSIFSSALLNLGLNFIFIPKYGYNGAAITTVISYAFLLIALVVISRKYFTWEFPFLSLLKVSASTIVMSGIVYPIGNGLITSTDFLNLIFGVSIGVVIYFLMIVILRELKNEEIKALNKFKRKIIEKISR